MTPTKKKNIKKTTAKPVKKTAAKSKIAQKKLIKPIKAIPAKKITDIAIKPAKRLSLYIDSCFFFPSGGSAYTDHFQGGRVSGNGLLQAPILLPVGSVMKTVTVYYKNNTSEDIQVLILKYHIDHHAYSGEVEVSLDSCPPGVLPPDNFLAKVIDHFDAGGRILDKYMYLIQIVGTIKNATEERTLRGVRIVYTLPS
ncbi:MAG: hypothetical protein KIT80_12135 [Chitinophagaceae bacterium]|nr:hypothetical protein [Chitinophagaceae bacterium]MCW5927651.1 hypothetical protein [Chitinophagaceae bacterium]